MYIELKLKLKMRLYVRGFIFIFLCFTTCNSLDDFTLSAVKSFVAYFSGAVVHMCNERDELQLSKALSSVHFRAAIYKPKKQLSLPQLLKTEYHHLAVIMDTSCTQTFQLLYQASEENLFTSLHHWLLISASDNAVITNENETKTVLEPLDLPINSHLTVAYRRKDTNTSLPLQDVYRIGKGQPLSITSCYTFSLGEMWPFPPRRDNYGGVSIKAAVLVVEDVWENFFDLRYRHLNTLSKNNFALMTHAARMLNFRMKLKMADQWGYPINGSQNYDGMVGMMQHGEVEIAASGLLIKVSRLDKVEYAGEVVTFRGAFMFLQPSLSDVSIIYILPFSPSVWITFMSTVMVLTFAEMFTNHIQHHFKHSKIKATDTWDETILNSIGVVCNQGASVLPENVPFRIIFLSLLLLSLFVITSYSAIIVSLLQTPGSAINSLTELIDSSFTLSMRNIGYNLNYINDSNNPLEKRVYFEKIYTQSFEEGFLSQEKGVEKIRTGLNAFHGDTGTYKVMNDVFKEHEKCRLKEIKMYAANKLALAVRKGSPYRDHIAQKARWLNEVGLRDREYKYWFYQKPKCNAGNKGFVSVRIGDFYPLLLILVIGIICAINMLVIEFIHFRIKKRDRIPLFM